MGIKDFLDIEIKDQRIYDYGIEVDVNYMKGKKIIIDAFNVIYQSRFAMAASSENGNMSVNVIKDDQEVTKITSHIKIILNKIQMLQKLDITQMWVFDGGYNPLKAKELTKRTGPKITKEEIADIKKLIGLMGIKYVTVSCEAEFFCAELVRSGMFDYVLTTDMDVIIRQGNLIMPCRRSKTKNKYFVLHYNDVIEKSGLNLETLARIAVMMGCDFCEKTRGVGVKTIMKKLNNALKEDQIIAMEFLLKPVAMREVIMEKPATEFNIDALKEWLREMGFGEKTLNSLN